MRSTHHHCQPRSSPSRVADRTRVYASGRPVPPSRLLLAAQPAVHGLARHAPLLGHLGDGEPVDPHVPWLLPNSQQTLTSGALHCSDLRVCAPPGIRTLNLRIRFCRPSDVRRSPPKPCCVRVSFAPPSVDVRTDPPPVAPLVAPLAMIGSIRYRSLFVSRPRSRARRSARRPSVLMGSGVTDPKCRCSGFEPAALDGRVAPGCPPGPATPCARDRRRAGGRRRR